MGIEELRKLPASGQGLMTGERNLRLIQEIEANRDFLLMAYRQNPALLAQAAPRIRQLMKPLESPPASLSGESRC